MRFVWALSLAAVALVLALVLVQRERDPSAAPRRSEPDPGSAAAALEGAGVPRGSSAEATDTPRDASAGPTRASPAPWHLLVRVHDDQGVVVPGATVSVWTASGQRHEFLRETQVGSEGTADLDLTTLASRSWSRLAHERLVGWAFAPGYSLGMPQTVGALPAGELRPAPWTMTFEMQKGQAARGRVVDPEGHGLLSVELLCGAPEVPDHSRPGQAFTAPDGRYAIPIQAESRADLIVSLRGYAREVTEPFDAKGGTDVLIPPLTLMPLDPVPGIARFPDGSPVAGLTLPVWHASFDPETYVWTPRLGPILARTDDAGRFTLALPPLGRHDGNEPYKVQFGGQHDRTGIVLDANATSHLLTMSPHRLRVRVRDAQGQALPGLDVSFHGDPERTCQGQTDTDGEVSLFPSPGAEGEIRFLTAGNHLVRRSVSVPKQGNESVQRIDVMDVREAGELRLRLESPEGLPIVQAHVQIDTEDGAEVAVYFFHNGETRIPLPAGTYRASRLWAYNLKWFPEAPMIDAVQQVPDHFVIRNGATLERTVRWTRSALLSVRVHPREVGEPVRWVTWLHATGAERQQVSWALRYGDSARKAHPWNETLFSSLYEPGTYVLAIEAEGYRPWRADVSLTGGRIEHVEIELERAR